MDTTQVRPTRSPAYNRSVLKLRHTMGGAAVISAVVGFVWLTNGTAHAQARLEPYPGTKASPGTEASLRRYIESLEAGKPNYGEMAPPLAKVVREGLPQILNIIYRVGALQSLAFQGVNGYGMDVYRVTFDHGQIDWRIAPLSPDGKVLARSFSELPEPR